MRPFKALLLGLLGLACLGLWGCGKQAAQPAEQEPVGSVYQIWQSDEWRPAYLHWLTDGSLLVGSVEPPGENSQGFCYMEIMDLEEGSSVSAVTVANLSGNWFYDVRTLDDTASGLLYLYQNWGVDSAVLACNAATKEFFWSNQLGLPAERPWAYMGRLRAEGRWVDWVLEIAPGQLWQTPVELLNPKFGEPVLLAAGEAIGIDLADYDVSPSRQCFVQLNYDGQLTAADLSGGRVAGWQLEPPKGWVNYNYVKFLPDNQTLAVSVLCEDRSVIQLWQLAADFSAPPSLLAEFTGLNSLEELAFLAAPDADHLLFNTESEVQLVNWRTGQSDQSNQIEKLYSATDYLKLRWGCKYLAAPADLHLLLDPGAAQGYVQTAAYDPESNRLAVIKYFPEQDVSQLIVLDNWQ